MTFITTLLWRIGAICALILALIGIPLPGLPTVPFLLLAAWCANRGWPRLEQWMLNHPHLGPPIRRWRESGVVSRKAKVLASVMIALSMLYLWLSPAPKGIATVVTLIVCSVLIWLWMRPEQANTHKHGHNAP